MKSRTIQAMVVVVVTVLLGLSLAKVSSQDPWVFSVGAGMIAAIAISIATLFSQETARLEKEVPPRKLLGMRIGTGGGLVALCGWFFAVFISRPVGYYVVALGMLSGLIGIVIHFLNMYGSEGQD